MFFFLFFLEGLDEDTAKKLEKRNDETSVGDARARYLQRKLERQHKL